MFSHFNILSYFRKTTFRQFLRQFNTASYAVIASYFTWKAFCIALHNDSPIVCVLTQSMEPGFKRGDILLLGHRSRDGERSFAVGDTAVYNVFKKKEHKREGNIFNNIPIVHRVIKENMRTRECLTKGDNNRGSDEPLYRPNQRMLLPEDMDTTVLGLIPYGGMPTIWISSIPYMRQGILLLTALYYFGSE